MRTLIAIPVFNEERHLEDVLREVRQYADDVLVIDDGSTDRTPQIIARLRDELGLDVIQRDENVGYGRSMQDAFDRAAERDFDWVITIDCDEQHEPASIPRFVEAAKSGAFDIVSGSRYMNFDENLVERDGNPPPDRRAINHRITLEINDRLASCLGSPLTDAFCGFKAYRVEGLKRLELSENGYAFPMQFWVQAAPAGLRVGEIPVRLIYTDEPRSFGSGLDDPQRRLAYYRRVMHCELEKCASRLPDSALEGVSAAGCG